MKNDNGNESAYPMIELDSYCNLHLGLTKREELAARNLAGLCANPSRTSDAESDLVRDAISMADLLLKELDK